MLRKVNESIRGMDFRFLCGKIEMGRISVHREDDEFSVSIWNVNILQEFRGNGYGKRMMKELDEMLTELCVRKSILFVDKKNEVALKLYRGMGYEIAPDQHDDSGGIWHCYKMQKIYLEKAS